ncbi:hypothetical protein [Saccharibacter floricola]|nr:hypothetical protein [Saccharibacter floricola]
MMAFVVSKAFHDVIFDISPPLLFDPHSTQPPRIDHGRTRQIIIRGTSMTVKHVVKNTDGKRRIAVRDHGEAAPDAIMLTEIADQDWEALKTLHASHPLLVNGVIRRVQKKRDGKSIGRELEGLRTHDRRLPNDRESASEEAQKRAEENRAPNTSDADTMAILEAMNR